MNPSKILNEILEERKRKNPGYSVRAFARDLEISNSMMSSVLNDKKRLSAKTADKIIRLLNLSPNRAQFFKQLVELEQTQDPNRRAKIIENIENQLCLKDLEAEKLKVIFLWQGFAVMELTLLPDFQCTPEWIAEKLGTTPSTANKVIENLFTLGMLKIGPTGKVMASGSHVANQSRKPSTTVKNYHRTMIRKALDSVDDEIQQRYLNQFMIATSDQGLELIRKEYEEFRNRVRTILSNEPRRDRILNLSFQAFRIDRPRNKDSQS